MRPRRSTAPGATVAFLFVLAGLVCLPAVAQAPEPPGIDVAQQRLEEIVVTDLPAESAGLWSTEVPGVRVTAGSAPGPNQYEGEAAEEEPALIVEMSPQALAQARVAVYAPEPIHIPGITKTIESFVWSSVGRLVNVRVIIHDNRGIEYKMPATGRGVPRGILSLTIAVPPSIRQRDFRSFGDDGISFVGIELVPIPNAEVPPEGLRFGLTEVRAFTDLFEGNRDSDIPEDWE